MRFFVVMAVTAAVAGYGPPPSTGGASGCGSGCGPVSGGSNTVTTHVSPCPGGNCGGPPVSGGSSSSGDSYWWQGQDNPFAKPGGQPSTGSTSCSGAGCPSRGPSCAGGACPPPSRPAPGRGPGTAPVTVQNLLIPPMGICNADYVCVHWQLCRNGLVIADGSGIIDKQRKVIPPQLASAYDSCGGDMICCGIPQRSFQPGGGTQSRPQTVVSPPKFPGPGSPISPPKFPGPGSPVSSPQFPGSGTPVSRPKFPGSGTSISPPQFPGSGTPVSRPKFPGSGTSVSPPQFPGSGTPVSPPQFPGSGTPVSPPQFPGSGTPVSPPQFPSSGTPVSPKFPGSGTPISPPKYSGSGTPLSPPKSPGSTTHTRPHKAVTTSGFSVPGTSGHPGHSTRPLPQRPSSQTTFTGSGTPARESPQSSGVSTSYGYPNPGTQDPSGPSPLPSTINQARPVSPSQPLRPVSNPVGLTSPPGQTGGMGGMMGMMGMMLPSGSCSAGTYCVLGQQCNPYTGFIMRGNTPVMAVWPDSPTVPLLPCFVPDGSITDGVCCQEPHPNAGGFD